MSISKTVQQAEKLEHFRDALVAYHRAARETFSNIEQIVLQISQARSSGYLEAPLGPNRDPFLYVLANTYDGLCNGIACLEEIESHALQQIEQKAPGWQQQVMHFATDHRRETSASAVTHGIHDAVKSIEAWAGSFFSEIFSKQDEEEKQRYKQVRSVSRLAGVQAKDVRRVNAAVAHVACTNVVELARSYQILKKKDHVIAAVKMWHDSAPAEYLPPYRARTACKAFRDSGLSLT